MKSLQILIFYQYFGTPNGCWSTRVYEFAKRWVNAGHKVTVVTSPYYKSDLKGNGLISKVSIDGINVIVINSGDNNKLPAFQRAIRAILFSVFSIYFALRLKYHVVISSSGPVTVGIPMIVAKVFRRKKTVFEVRDLWPGGADEMGLIRNKVLLRLAYFLEKLCYRSSDLIVACSPGMSEDIKHRYNYENIIIIPNSSDLKIFSPKSNKLPYGDKYFIYTGSLGIMDDPDQFIDAFKKLKDKDIKLVVFGDGSLRKELEQKVKHLGLDNVTFFGLVPKTEVAKWLTGAYASIITMANYRVLQHSSPNKLFDAFAAGVPVIQNTNGWIKDMIQKEKCGISVPQNDPVAFSDAIEYLYNNPQLREEMAINAKRLAENQFDRDKLSNRYIKSIESLLHG